MIDRSAYDGSGPPYPGEATECAGRGGPLDPERVPGRPFMRYCPKDCCTRAWRRRDRLRARAQPPARPPPEKAAAITAECRHALALLEFAVTGVDPYAEAPASR